MNRPLTMSEHTVAAVLSRRLEEILTKRREGAWINLHMDDRWPAGGKPVLKRAGEFPGLLHRIAVGPAESRKLIKRRRVDLCPEQTPAEELLLVHLLGAPGAVVEDDGDDRNRLDLLPKRKGSNDLRIALAVRF